jgi:chromosome partition protein MukE
VTQTFNQLQDVIEDAEFPALDLALRRGFHVDRDSAGWYTLLSEGQALLEGFYRRYGCELIYKTDGYFYLLPTGDQLPRRQLSAQDMLVGQALALLYLDPISLERGGIVTREQVIEQLVAALGTAPLMAAFVPKRRRKDEQVAQRQTRAKVAEAIRRLAALGFAEMLANEQLRLRPALLRFAEPVRGLAEPAAALAQLVARGEVALVEDEVAAGPQLDSADEGETEVAEGEQEVDAFSGEDETDLEADGAESDSGEARP